MSHTLWWYAMLSISSSGFHNMECLALTLDFKQLVVNGYNLCVYVIWFSGNWYTKYQSFGGSLCYLHLHRAHHWLQGIQVLGPTKGGSMLCAMCIFQHLCYVLFEIKWIVLFKIWHKCYVKLGMCYVLFEIHSILLFTFDINWKCFYMMMSNNIVGAIK